MHTRLMQNDSSSSRRPELRNELGAMATAICTRKPVCNEKMLSRSNSAFTDSGDLFPHWTEFVAEFLDSLVCFIKPIGVDQIGNGFGPL